MGEPLVSVIVPVYNSTPYLEKCVCSITAQMYKNLEVILVDDGSEDGSGNLCDEFAAKDARVVAIHSRNEGAGKARNRALDIARGEWIAFVDSDDIVETWYVDALLTAVLAEDAEVALGGYRMLQSSNRGLLVEPTERQPVVSARRALEMLMYQEGVDTAPWGKLFRADKFKNVRFPSLASSEDLATIYKPLLKSTKVAIVRDSGYRYRTIEGSLSCSNREEAAWDVARNITEEILGTYPDLNKACSCRRLSFAFHVMAQTHDQFVMNELWNEIVDTRACVLRDSRARRKARAAALASFAGRRIALAIARLKKQI